MRSQYGYPYGGQGSLLPLDLATDDRHDPSLVWEDDDIQPESEAGHLFFTTQKRAQEQSLR